MSDKLITVAGSVYCQPILDLVERLLQKESRKVVAGRIGYRENGYAVSVILLSVVAFESYVGRVRYLQSQRVPPAPPKPEKKKKREAIPDYLAGLSRSFRLQKSLTEVFVLRDVLAHGHVWELDISPHKTHGQILRQATLLPGYGDYKYDVAINPRTRRSTICGLNLVPSAIGLNEVAKVLDIIQRSLESLAKANLIERNSFSFHGRFRGVPFDFWKLPELLRSVKESQH